MFTEVIEKMIDMGLNEEFCFIVEEDGIEYHLGVKLIDEFSTLMIIVGNHGGGFNMVFLANDNIVNRDDYLREVISEEFAKELSTCKFVGFCDIVEQYELEKKF